MTRRELLDVTGLSRTTLVERIDALRAARLVREGQRRTGAGGRPPTGLEFDDASGAVLAVDVGAVHVTYAVTDLSARLVALRRRPVDLDGPPDAVLAEVVADARRMLDDHRPADSRLLGVGVGFPGLPGPDGCHVEAPAVLRHWDGVAVTGPFATAFGVPVRLVNDAHAMAYGEFLADGRRRSLLVVKVATGIGAGLVLDGLLHLGDSRGAGQFGHMRVPDHAARCTCGKRGCLATLASGRALLRSLRPTGLRSLDDLVAAAGRGDPAVVAALRTAGDAVGRVLAGVVTMVDPGAVLLGGPLGSLDPFVSATRRQIKALAYARTARAVEVRRTSLGEQSGVTGLAMLVVDRALVPEAVDELIGSPRSAHPLADRRLSP